MVPWPAVALALLSAAPGRPFAPTSAYEARTVRGWAVLVHPEVLKHRPEADAALRELDGQLGRVAAAVPAGPLAELRKVRVWVEWEAKPRGAAEFHVSAGYLAGHGYNPDKLLGVEINNARNFVGWSRRDQPWMALHELAHAYHFRVLGADHPGIAAAYKQAKDRRLYEKVLRAGRTERAYALTNAGEYFAELSEAYFGRNDFYPFTRAELEKHDPAGFALMRETWGDPKPPKPAP